MLPAGFCVAYLVFIAQNLAPMTGYRGVYFILGACPVVVALAMLRGVRALAPFSLIADAANVLGKYLYARQQATRLLSRAYVSAVAEKSNQH